MAGTGQPLPVALAVRAAVFLVGLAACGGAPARSVVPVPGSAIFGTWALADGSGIVMQIDGVPGKVSVDAWSGETHFDVSAVAWDGRRFHATFVYPPTRVTTTSDLFLSNPDRLEGTVAGAYEGRETWLRTQP